jgi:hypothetical protein
VDPDDVGGAPHILVDQAGTTHLAWERRGQLQVTRRQAGESTWSEPVVAIDGFGAFPGFAWAAAPSGELVFAYLRSRATRRDVDRVVTTSVATDGSVEPEQQLSSPGAEAGGRIDLAVDGAGVAHVTWLERPTRDAALRVRYVRRDPGSPWGASRWLSSSRSVALSADLDVTPVGAVAVAWSATRTAKGIDDYGTRLVARTFAQGPGWSVPQPLTRWGREVRSFAVLALDGGRAPVAFALNRRWLAGRVAVVSRLPDGSWTRAHRLTTLRGNAELAFARGPGVVALTWRREMHWNEDWFTFSRHFVAVRQRDGWTVARAVTPNREYAGPLSVEFGPSGRLLLGWAVFNSWDRDPSLYAVRARDPDGTWAPPVGLTVPAGLFDTTDGDLAVDPVTGLGSVVMRGQDHGQPVYFAQELAPATSS